MEFKTLKEYMESLQYPPLWFIHDFSLPFEKVNQFSDLPSDNIYRAGAMESSKLELVINFRYSKEPLYIFGIDSYLCILCETTRFFVATRDYMNGWIKHNNERIEIDIEGLQM